MAFALAMVGRWFRLPVCLLVLGLAACTDTAEKTKMPQGRSLFFECMVRGEEGTEEVVCLFQFKSGGPNGSPVLSTGEVALDGQAIQPDSTRYGGTYYEQVRSSAGFTGNHTVTYESQPGKTIRETFAYQPFTFSGDWPASLKRADFRIKLENFPDEETPVRILLTDTAFATNDVHEIMAVEGAELFIPGQMLALLKPGPIALELYREDKRTIMDKERWGRITVSYGLKRTFELTP